MLSKLRTHLTYANVMASLALFLVLTTGTAVALKGTNTVLTDDIKDGHVRRQDLGGSSVRSSKVADRSLRKKDFAAGQLPKGAISFNFHVQLGTDDREVKTVNGLRFSVSCYDTPEVGIEFRSISNDDITISGLNTRDGEIRSIHQGGETSQFWSQTTNDFDGVVARNSVLKWIHFDVGSFHGGASGCNYWGLITPPSN